ncbi:putative reverse transcriptase domain-containing protein [Tanacetum coccineum]
MEVSACSSAGVWPCPFRGFHCCPDGMAGSKGFPRLVAHIKRLHLSSDDRRGALREALSTDCELFVSVGEALKALDQWLCGVCMCLHALSRACHHTDGMTRFKWVAGDVEEFIVGIVRPQVRREVVPLGGVVVDEVLLDPVLLGKVAASTNVIEAWVNFCCYTFARCVFSGFKTSVRRRGGTFGSSCWAGGLTCPIILDALCGEGSAITVGLLKAISVVVNLLLEGRCPKVLAEFMASAPLTPLLKPDNGIRPIAVGAIWRGVGHLEAVLHRANIFLNKFHSNGSLAMLTVDFSNVFNLVDQTTLIHEVRTRCPSISLWVDFLYGQSARLYVGDDHIWSTTGVQQGDPLGPLLFALVLHPLVHRIRDCCQLLFHAWYLDDGTIIGDTKEVAKAIDIIRAEGPRLGLELNIKKTEVFWPSCNGVKVKEGLFPRDIGRPTLGVKLLGGAVSRDAGFISSLAVKRASRAVELMSLLPSLRDPQSELLLLRSCMGIAKLLFGLRTCQPMYIGEVVSIFDNGLRRAIEAIVGCSIDGADSDYGYALDRVRMSLPEFDLSVSFDLSPRQKAVVECLRAPRAQNFLTVIPIEGLGQHMSALEYRTILKYRLMIPLHDLLGLVLYDVLKRAGISSRKEAPVNFLTDPLEGRSTLRPADILVFGWAGGKHACVDLTGVSPLVGLHGRRFVAGQAALKAESSKVAKHEKACLENQHVFIPFAFDTFGFLAPEAEEFLNRVQRVVQSNFSTPKTQNFIFSRISFAIQKGVAAQLVARLPAILL